MSVTSLEFSTIVEISSYAGHSTQQYHKLASFIEWFSQRLKSYDQLVKIVQVLSYRYLVLHLELMETARHRHLIVHRRVVV